MGRKKARFYKDLEKQNLPKVDSNATVMLPTERAMDPTSNRLVEINAAAEKMSRRKEKALEKYIAKKLKKDERSSLWDRLQKSSFTSSDLQSTKTLHQAKKAVKEEKLEGQVGSDSDSDSDSGSNDEYYEAPKPRSIPSTFQDITELASEKNPFKPLKEVLQPTFLETSSSESEEEPVSAINLIAEPTFNVPVERPETIQEQRSQLPVFAEEQNIMETIRSNPVVIICGETGSGKTTQVPQFLYEAGYGSTGSVNPGIIGVTQPRRVAAVSMAERVGVELNNPKLCSYQIRYDSSNVTNDTKVKFMTDGILIREIQNDFLLTKYSVILLDEAHERNLNTDILVGLLSRIVKLRWKKALETPDKVRPLRLVIMSATLNISDFRKLSLFNPLPPVIKVDARQHPVTMHFSRRTNEDYVEEAFKTVSKIHANLPAGGILVFMSGKREIMTLVQKLRKKYPMKDDSAFSKEEQEFMKPGQVVDEADFASDIESEGEKSSSEESNIDADSESDGFDDDEDELKSDVKTTEPLYVLPLFSLLSPQQQMRIFSNPPNGARLCVVATNVAETSITIKNIRYVVDSGKVKQRLWDSEGRQRYEVVWCSKASSAQRAGRAGRTGPGHCYRLFSSAVFDNDFPEHAPPEISRIPMEGLVLNLKNMNIDNVENFPLPTEPALSAIKQAQENLVQLSALDDKRKQITSIGRKMAHFPLNPTWSRMLVNAVDVAKSQPEALKFLPSVILFVSAMTVGDPFGNVKDGEDEEEVVKEKSNEAPTWKQFAGKPVSSDLFPALGVLYAYLSESPKQRASFCRRHNLLQKRLEEMQQQVTQLIRMVRDFLPNFTVKLSEMSNVCSVDEKTFIRRLLAQAFPFQIAEKVSIQGSLIASASTRSLAAKLPAYKILGKGSVATALSEDPTSVYRFLHPTSSLVKIPPKFIVFTESLTTLDAKTQAPRHYLKNVTAIEPEWIPSRTLSNSL